MTEVEELRSKLAEAERERDASRSRDATRELLLKEAQANCDELEEERDAALAELEKLRGEAEWRLIDTMPKGEEIFMAATADGRITIVRGSILANMMKRSTPDHLQFPAVAWKLLPSPPKDPAHA